ncbi:hypothetical protein V6N13_090844 [Hibiscus sabdariffa]|uniref:Xylanase inhibitor N-terminal domain-containing protein n=1 Tax=Hibiscus sabdariffa TaxID=183260 RepID=A0ABR2A0A9_9ROSI
MQIKTDIKDLICTQQWHLIPLLQIPFAVDLNGRLLWVTCEENYLSSAYCAPRCCSTRCAPIASPSSDQGATTCGLMSVNPITSLTTMGELAQEQDVLSIHSTGGSNPGSLVMIPLFLFTCAPSLLLHTVFPGNVLGGYSSISLPTQLASHFGFAVFAPTFSLCLAPNGVIFFGDTPYGIHPGIDISCTISYTPLIIGSHQLSKNTCSSV